VKSIAPVSFISTYPPKGHQPKRPGPLITIKTSTFVELLGRAREWDGKFSALAGASRAYLVESFTFGDELCVFATEADLKRFAIVEVYQGRPVTRCGALIVAITLLFLAFATCAFAQGDDFPGIPIGGNPTYIPGPLPGQPPLPSIDPNSGWRTKGPVQKLWNVRRGDTVVVLQDMQRCSGCYWGFAIATIMPVASNSSDMQLIDGGPGGWDHGDAGAWCLRCTWQFTAGDDFPELALAYYGSGNFFAILEVQAIYPAPPPPMRQAVPQAKKDAARAKAASHNAWGAGLGLLAAAACGYLPTEVCVAIAAMSGAFQLDAQRLNDVAADPPDVNNYPYPYEPVYNWYVVPWFSPLPEDGSVGWMGMAPWINAYVAYATVTDGLNDMAYQSANRASGADVVGDYGTGDWQEARTEWALRTAGEYYNYVASDLWAFQWFFANYWDPYFDLGNGPDYLSNQVGQMAQSYSELAWIFQQ